MDSASLQRQRLARMGILVSLVTAPACTDRTPLAPNASSAVRAPLAQVTSDQSVGAVFVATNATAGNAVIGFRRPPTAR